MNKNVSLWKGDDTPPTNYHVWLKSDNSLNIHSNLGWVTLAHPNLADNLITYVDQQIDAIKDSVDIDFDTLKEIADWIKQHEEDYVLVLPQLQTQLEALRADVNNTVTLDTDQTITGVKTFTEEVTSPSFVVSGGTSDEFLKADGSIDNTVYAKIYDIPTTLTQLTNNLTNLGNVNVGSVNQPVYFNNGIPTPTNVLQTNVYNKIVDNTVDGWDELYGKSYINKLAIIKYRNSKPEFIDALYDPILVFGSTDVTSFLSIGYNVAPSSKLHTFTVGGGSMGYGRPWYWRLKGTDTCVYTLPTKSSTLASIEDMPTKTSQLIKDDVYMKSEVYNTSQVNELINTLDGVVGGIIDTWRPIHVQNSSGSTILTLGDGSTSGDITLKAGTNLTASVVGSTVTFDTTYNLFDLYTQSQKGVEAYNWGNHAGKYPTYNGTGATGTWGININGSAKKLTIIQCNKANANSKLWDIPFRTDMANTFNVYEINDDNCSLGTYVTILDMVNMTSTTFHPQIAITAGATPLIYIRNKNWFAINDTHVFGNWRQLAFNSDIPTKLSDLTDDVVEGNYLPMAESTYDITDTTNVLKHDGSWGIPELAEDLGGREETHHEEFFFQPTASNDLSIKDGYAKIKSLKGNTIVWNQICINGNFENLNSWARAANANISVDNNIATVTTSSNGDNYITQLFNFTVNHKYYVSLNTKSSRIDTLVLFIYFGGSTNHVYKRSTKANEWEKQKILFTVVNNTYNEIRLQIPNVDVINQYKNIRIHDLTQMFGEGNEPTIEEFEAMYPDDYYEYNEGELRSFNGSAIKSVGFNQWDEEWENGAFGTNGENLTDVQSSIHTKNKNKIKVLPNTNYYFKTTTPIFGFWYDSNMNFITWDNYSNKNIISPTNAHYLNFYLYQTNKYNNDVCLNLSHSGYRNGQYEPYKESILQLPIKTIKDNNGNLLFPDGLRSAGTAYDEIVYDEALGKYKAIKRIGDVDMGTLNWQYGNFYGEDTFKGFYSQLSAKYLSSVTLPNCISIKYTNITPSNQSHAYVNTNKTIAIYVISLTSSTPYIIIGDKDYTTPSDFKQSLQGQILYYELETPIEVVLDNIDLSYEAWDFGTEELLSDVATTPIITETQYNFNAVDMLRDHQRNIQLVKQDLLKVNDKIQAAITSAITQTLNTSI